MDALTPLQTFLSNLASFIAGLAGICFTIAFIIYGIKLAGSAGNPPARANAIAGPWWTVIGAIVSFGAYFIVDMLKGVAGSV